MKGLLGMGGERVVGDSVGAENTHKDDKKKNDEGSGSDPILANHIPGVLEKFLYDSTLMRGSKTPYRISIKRLIKTYSVPMVKTNPWTAA